MADPPKAARDPDKPERPPFLDAFMRDIQLLMLVRRVFMIEARNVASLRAQASMGIIRRWPRSPIGDELDIEKAVQPVISTLTHVLAKSEDVTRAAFDLWMDWHKLDYITMARLNRFVPAVAPGILQKVGGSGILKPVEEYDVPEVDLQMARMCGRRERWIDGALPADKEQIFASEGQLGIPGTKVISQTDWYGRRTSWNEYLPPPAAGGGRAAQ